MKYYGGSLIRALTSVFPDIGLQESKFAKLPRMLFARLSPKLIVCLENYLDDVDNRRKYLADFAKNHGFDPLVHENWSSSTINALRSEKVHFRMYISYFS